MNKTLKLTGIVVGVLVLIFVLAHHLPGFEALVRKVHGG